MVRRSIKLTSLSVASEYFGISNCGELFGMQIEQDWGHKVSGLMLKYDQHVLLESRLLNSRMDCCINVNYFTILLLLSVWDLIAR
jgi:hypothetical protein